MQEISATNEDYNKYRSVWEQLYASMEGQFYIKSQGETFLPYPIAVNSDERLTEDFKTDYKIYIDNALFVEYTSEAVEDLTSSAFRKEPEIDPPPPDKLEYYDYPSDAKELTKQTLTYGRCFVLVDYPVVTEYDIEAVAYTEIYPPLSVINWETSRYSGKDTLTRVVLKEATTPDYQIYRELILEENIYKVRIYHDDEFIEEFIPQAGGATLTEIPGVFLGSTNNSAKVDKSPVISISNSNLAHYQTFAELMSTQTYLGHPQVAISNLPAGFNKQQKDEKISLQVGAGKALTMEGDDVKISLLEINPQTIHFETLKKLEQSMADTGLKLKSQTTSGVESSQTIKTKNSQYTSKLAAVVNNVELALEDVYRYISLFMGTPYEPDITLNKEFLEISADPQMVTTLSSAETVGTIPTGSTYTYTLDTELFVDEDPEKTIVTLDQGPDDTGTGPIDDQSGI